MREHERRELIPELKTVVAEASQALAFLDSARLEELAKSCETLNRRLVLEHTDTDVRQDLAQQVHEAQAGMAVFGMVLDATRANLSVMKRLREMRLGQLEYTAPQGAARWVRARAEDGDGND
jgi:hypothetical protein